MDSTMAHDIQRPPTRSRARGGWGFAIGLAIAAGFAWWYAARPAVPDSEKLTGRWLRPDGGYVLQIASVSRYGAMNARYLNPLPIHMARAEAFREAGAMKVFIELRDVNYPGSTYTLTYNELADRLEGIYYQAVEKKRFDVVFERVK